jgi:hypothetical protein
VKVSGADALAIQGMQPALAAISPGLPVALV